MSDLNDMFFQECDDLLEALSTGLTELESGQGDDEVVNGMFRAVHSIKGGAGAFGLDQLVSFSHAMENVLDDMRSDKLAVDDTVVSLLFTSADHLSDLVEAARNGDELPAEQGASILGDLKLMSGSEPPVPAGSDEQEEPDFQPLTLSIDGDLPSLDDMIGPAHAAPIVLEFTAHARLYENGHDPALLFRHLEELGNLAVEADLDGVRPLQDTDWSVPALSWRLTLAPDEMVDHATVRDVFDFVDGLCDLDFIDAEAGPDMAASPPPPDVSPLPGGSGEGPDKRADLPAKGKAPGPSGSAAKPVARSSTIRVDLDRVDRLINLVGELVIAEAMLRQSMDELTTSASSGVNDAMGQLKQLSGAIQESVMAIRAQPVRSLFQRMSRIVREAAKEAGKSARLVTHGEATEIDKTVIERLVDPLTHMIRNAVDHGLEPPDTRRSVGKEERGIVTLEAAHRSGRVVITLSDDGAGINRARVRQIAVNKGLVRADEELSEADVDNLLFRPGFSTADEVSSLSGRGVGMDVVRNEIQALGGRVSLQSVPGKGTSVTISLPLTLAVLEGMVVRVADQSLIVPTLPLREMLQPGQARIHTLCDGDRVLALGNELIPISDLGAALGYRSEPGDIEAQSLLLIEGDSGRRSALAVDTISEQREVVIKGLEQNYQSIPGIAAATILGDGKIALIVDTDQMITVSKPSPMARPGQDIAGDSFHA